MSGIGSGDDERTGMGIDGGVDGDEGCTAVNGVEIGE
jgi:hypothetical protein